MNYTTKELLEMDPVEVYKLRLNGTITNFPLGFFSEKTLKKDDKYARIIRYLIEDVLKCTDEDILKKITSSTLKKYYLGSMLKLIFDSIYDLINHAYPGRFKPWELNNVPKNYWTKETAKEAIKWMIEEKLKWSHDDICKKLTRKIFFENGLDSIFDKEFDGKIYEAINYIYPGQFKPWQLNTVSHDYWNKETAKEATVWLIEENLQWTDDEIRKNLTRKSFRENGLGGMFNIIFNNSTYAAINCIYPDRFKPWELKQAPQGFWNEETAKEAIIWLFEEKLKWTDEEICEKLTKNIFYENGLLSMFQKIYNSNIYLVLNNAYPGKFEKVGKSIKLAE